MSKGLQFNCKKVTTFFMCSETSGVLLLLPHPLRFLCTRFHGRLADLSLHKNPRRPSGGGFCVSLAMNDISRRRAAGEWGKRAQRAPLRAKYDCSALRRANCPLFPSATEKVCAPRILHFGPKCAILVKISTCAQTVCQRARRVYQFSEKEKDYGVFF